MVDSNHLLALFYGKIPMNRENDIGVLSQLPDEIVFRILLYLDWKSLARTSQVSKRLYRLSNDQYIWLVTSLTRI